MEIGIIKPTDIRDEMQGAYLDYAMSVITARALPDIRDGLKPVQRRILYGMWDMGLRHNVAYKKCARIVGDVLGRYHPHGDQAVYDALVRMAQDFTMRYPLIDGQGNFGSIDNDPPAAMRYTEARLTELAEEMLLDIEKDTVDFRPNFDETLQEPTVLPAKVPNLILNGTAGIAVGMATLIPPHNLVEVIDAVDYIIEHWNNVDDIQPDDLMQFVKGPDFPTGGIILGVDGIREAYATGKGRIVVRAKIHTEQVAGGRSRIVVTELPYQVNKSALIERIAELVRDRKLEEIGDLRDESDRQGMSIIVELKRGVEPTPVIKQLLRHTALQTAFSVNMLALVDGEPHVLSLKRVLQLYVQHRQNVITRRSKFELERAKLRAHILEGLKIALDNLDEVIRTIRQSPDADTARERLMKRFKLSELQATAILDMQLRRLAALERKKIEEELAEVHKRIRLLEELIRSPKKILGVVREELDDLKERFGDARRTFISGSSETEYKEEGHGEEEQALVSLTRDGNIRRAPLSTYRRTRSDAVKGVQSREEDPVEQLFVAGTLDNLALFTNRGRALPLRMSQVPDVSRNPIGASLKNQLESGERFIGALPLNSQFITLGTTGGKIKRTGIDEFSGLQSGGVRAVNLAEGDELGWARATNGGGEYLLVTAQGQALRFKEDEVPVQGRVAAGVWAIKLSEGDRVVALEPVTEEATLVIASARGFAKRTALKEFPIRGRYTAGVSAFSPDARTGNLVAARVVEPEDDIQFLTVKGTVVRVRVENVAKANRTSRGKLAVDLKGDDMLAAVVSLTGAIEGQPAGPEEDKPEQSAPEARPKQEPKHAEVAQAVRASKESKLPDAERQSKAAPQSPAPKAQEKKQPEAVKPSRGTQSPTQAPKAQEKKQSEAAKPAAIKGGDGHAVKGDGHARREKPPEPEPAKKGRSSPRQEADEDEQLELDFPKAAFKPLPKKK